MEQFFSPATVCERTSISRSTLDRLVAAGTFPKPIKITDRRIAFRSSDVEAWIATKVEAA